MPSVLVPTSGCAAFIERLFSQLLSSPLEEVTCHESSSSGKTSGFFPPWCKQMRGKISITILFPRSQLGAGRLENAA